VDDSVDNLQGNREVNNNHIHEDSGTHVHGDGAFSDGDPPM
jgi:hypothetical protein